MTKNTCVVLLVNISSGIKVANFVSCSGHIEGAVRFNIDEIADKSAPLPRTVPPPDQFGEQVGKVCL